MEKNGVILHIGLLMEKLLGLHTYTKKIACVSSTSWWATLPFLLSAHYLKGAYLLTTEGDKHMCELTKL